jgi:hypothetical protein
MRSTRMDDAGESALELRPPEQNDAPLERGDSAQRAEQLRAGLAANADATAPENTAATPEIGWEAARRGALSEGRFPDHAHDGRPYTEVEKIRAAALEIDPMRPGDVVPHEAEAALAADREHGLLLERNPDGGIDFRDVDTGEDWDAMALRSYTKAGDRIVLNEDAIRETLRHHVRKANVLCDHAYLEDGDRATVSRIEEEERPYAERLDRKMLVVRD